MTQIDNEQLNKHLKNISLFPAGCLEPLGLTVTHGAKVLGVSRQAFE